MYCRYIYSTNQSQYGVSMVLPSGFVYDRALLQKYAALQPLGVLAYVDETTNCDDLLFNFLAANSSGCGPVVVNLFAKALQMG
jgi:hypothetical protein